jgi:glutathione S-transferase
MITLHHFQPYHGLPDPSPFCLKVDLYLRAAGLEFRSEPGLHNMRRSPKHKLPFITDGARTVPDSQFIIEYLKQEYGDPLDGALNARDRAIAHAFIRMLDENLYWCMVYARWIDESVWSVVKNEFFGAMPLPLRLLVPALAQRNARKTLYRQGLGRHSHEEILHIAKRDLTALSDLLGTRDYFLTNSMTTLDVTAFAFLAQLIIPPHHGDFMKLARSFGNLVHFTDRVKQKFYPA